MASKPKKKAKKSKATRQPARRLRLEWMPLNRLPAWPRNPKGHDIPSIQQSIERFGFTNPILLDERTGRMVAGHGRAEALQRMQKAGLPAPANIRVEGRKWLVPVIRGNNFETERDADMYVVADNRLVERGGWDEAELAELLRPQPGDQLEGTGWSERELSRMLKRHPDESQPADPAAAQPDQHDDQDRALVMLEKWQVKPGQLWTAGPHRILCGDSMVDRDVDRLRGGREFDMVLTDPPYAIYGSSTGIGSDIADDSMVRPFFERTFRQIHRTLKTFGHCYVHCDWRSWAAIMESARRASMTVNNMLVWDKGDAGLGTQYYQCYELVGFFTQLPPPRAMKSTGKTGQRLIYGRGNILRFNRPTGDDRQHNAAKPVPMLEELLVNSSEAGQAVLDLFCGSGSTMEAAHRQNRECYAMEEKPKWVAVTLERMERLGLQPRLDTTAPDAPEAADTAQEGAAGEETADTAR